MKLLAWISLIIGAVVVINEFSYINETSLAWVLIGLAVAVILNSIALLSKKSQL